MHPLLLPFIFRFSFPFSSPFFPLCSIRCCSNFQYESVKSFNLAKINGCNFVGGIFFFFLALFIVFVSVALIFLVSFFIRLSSARVGRARQEDPRCWVKNLEFSKGIKIGWHLSSNGEKTAQIFEKCQV